MAELLRYYTCAAGHRWDVWGRIGRTGAFVPGGQPAIFYCPTCNGPAQNIEGNEHERLA